MRLLFSSFVAIQLAIASQASSSEIRIQNLAESRLLDRFSDFFGPCVRSLSSSRIVLTCINEGKKVRFGLTSFRFQSQGITAHRNSNTSKAENVIVSNLQANAEGDV